MGTANKIPGVSGGIVALIGGFYEELIFSIEKLDFKALKYFSQRNFKKFFIYTNSEFLTLLFLGIIISFFSASLILDFLLSNYEKQVWGLFFGMITSSLIILIKGIAFFNKKTIINVIIGLILGLFISFSTPLVENDNLYFVFFCGIISVSGITIPGLSGSFLLLILGNYNLLLVDAVNTLLEAIINITQFNFVFFQNEENHRFLLVLIVFVLGSILGLIVFSKFIGFFLRNHRQSISGIIIGFIFGTTPIIWPWKDVVLKIGLDGNPIINRVGNYEILKYSYFIPKINNISTLYIFSTILMGFLIIQLLEYYGEKK